MIVPDNAAIANKIDEDLDLFEILHKIWGGRALIVSVVLFVAIVSGVVLKLMPSYYKIEATIDSLPREQLRPLFPSGLVNADYQVLPPDEKKVFYKAVLQISSIGNIRKFWEKNTGKQLPSDGAENDDFREFKRFAKGFSVDALNPKSSDLTAYKIGMESLSKVVGVALMNDYLDFVGREVLRDQVEQLEASYQASLDMLALNYANKTLIEERRLSDQLINLKESLKMAGSMGIVETPFKQLENIQLKLMDSKDYLLGAKSLSSQIEILSARQGKSLAPYSAELRAMETMRDQMNSDITRLKSLEGRIKLFSIVNAPEASIDPVKPKKLLILLAITAFALVCSVVYVLISAAVTERRASNR